VRLLFAIPHFFRRDGALVHGSRTDAPRERTTALTTCLASLHQVFGSSQRIIDWSRGVAVRANSGRENNVDVVVCTTRGHHLLNRLRLPRGSYEHRATRAEPMLLGFECQAVLRERLGSYDFYCFLEDDTVLHDPWFFSKLSWFSRRAGATSLLQPSRYEVASAGPARKVYVDGDIPARYTKPYQDVTARPVILRRHLGARVLFRRAKNPHSAAYFLTGEQLSRWARKPYFCDRDTSFVGPLESAATLGIMRTFRVYKPATANADFLEVQHFGGRLSRLLE
jgi:hypothetical protein